MSSGSWTDSLCKDWAGWERRCSNIHGLCTERPSQWMRVELVGCAWGKRSRFEGISGVKTLCPETLSSLLSLRLLSWALGKKKTLLVACFQKWTGLERARGMQIIPCSLHFPPTESPGVAWGVWLRARLGVVIYCWPVRAINFCGPGE